MANNLSVAFSLLFSIYFYLIHFYGNLTLFSWNCDCFEIASKRVSVAFYSVRTLEGVWGYSPCMGAGAKPCGRKWFYGISKG